MLIKHASFLLLFTALLAGCSIYQSEGRKFLEGNALQFAANSSSKADWSFAAYNIQEPCAELVDSPVLAEDEWSLAEQSLHEDLKLYQSEQEHSYDMLMYFKNADEREFLCAFYYTDLSQQLQQMDRDLNLGFQAIQALEQF